MQTSHETRKLRLEMLIKQHGSIATLNVAIGWSRSDPKLSQIRNSNTRPDRPDKQYNMGDNMARQIEQALNLERGWMDTPPSYAELRGEEDHMAKAEAMLLAMEPTQLYMAMRLLETISQSSEKDDQQKLVA